MKKVFGIIAISFFCSRSAQAQSSYAQDLVNTLCAQEYWGRGYTNDGMHKAALFIEGEMKKMGLQSLGGASYLQSFTIPVNTFPGKMSLSLDGKSLMAGRDFIVSPDSKGLKGNFTLSLSPDSMLYNKNAALLIVPSKKLTWSASPKVENATIIELLDSSNIEYKKAKVDIENRFVPQFELSNVCGMVKGTLYPDSFLVITAHYDHLGGMGDKTYFPGANDNASGTALLLDLAQYYASHPQPYSVAFISFAAEEIGLKGSKYFVKHPLVPLSQIRFLLNLDLMGNGEDGITVVNATEYPKAFDLLTQLNTQHHWFSTVNSRGKAANSDHYYFSEQGVPAFFIYTLGGNKAYHDINDVPQTLPLKHFDDLKDMIRLFFEAL